jgi:uncharacterized OB-fold protein
MTNTLIQVPLHPELFRLDAGVPVLLGSRCPACERSFFPRRWECPVDQSVTDDVDLSQEGTLHVSTYVHFPAYGRARTSAKGYGVGQIDLPEGVRVQALLVGDPESWRRGARLRVTAQVIDQDADGRERAIFRFQTVD